MNLIQLLLQPVFKLKKVQYYARQLLHLLEEKENVSEQLITKAKQLSDFELLTSFPGIGEISAALFIGEIGNLSRFSNHKKSQRLYRYRY
ncbi:transposase [Virgibacillus halophilus]|uniref:Transposase n=1 Tax=Tigheibacillus halophilus TaxID=361280 RepID=A0ABU5C344_9BACI|nr:transposase [Virgibacillus halophilus]